MPHDRLVTPARALPASPNLEQQKKQARELLRAVNAGDPSALDRMRARHPRFADRGAAFALADAQLVIAREYGFLSWPAFKACIDGLAQPGPTQPYVKKVSWYEDRAQGLVEMHRGAMPTALAQIRAWHPALADRTDAEIAAAPFTMDDARIVYARQHGSTNWAALVARVSAIEGSTGPGSHADIDIFARAFAAIERADAVSLRALVDRHRSVITQRGSNGNTLLNLAVAIGDDASPLPSVLLDAGADPNVPNDRGWTPLHAAAAGDKPTVLARLLSAGAVVTISAHGDGGTPLAVALWWAKRGIAATLAAIAIAPDNLRVNAALDRATSLDRFFDADGGLTLAAGSGRGFYRPHSGFPAWTPSGARREVLDDALAWAARNDAVAAMTSLVTRGADVNGVAYRGTPLMFAIFFRHLDAARWLLDHGADPNALTTFHGRDKGRVTALHLAAQTDEARLVDVLLDHGADRTIHDETYHADAAGWARYVGASHTLKLLE